MAELDHWHPVLTSAELHRAKPQGVVLCGEEIVVFRTAGGRVGALVDVCPHRRMRLSLGKVEGERLVCPYHGWRYQVNGEGESPGTPRLHACAEHYDVIERHGAVWIKRAGAVAAFPDLKAQGYTPVGVIRRRVNAPLEPVLDNFTEVEHTPTTHALFGYPLEAMDEVETRIETRDDAVRVYNAGPQKPVPWIVSKIFGIETGDTFVDDWTTYFSPVFTLYDHYWIHADGTPHPERIRLGVFLNPITPDITDIVAFPFVSTLAWGRFGLNKLLRPLTAALVDREVRLDKEMIENLADKNPSHQGLKLGRFDLVLAETRRRIDRIYRGK